MTKSILLEICVESIDHAIGAEAGGADRIELCADLSCGGVTPSAALMRTIRDKVRIPIYVLIRPRAGNFCYTKSEMVMIERDIDLAREIEMDGIVTGVLDQSNHVDRERTQSMVQRAQPLPVTFHRAFDQCPDLNAALETVIETGAIRVLTSGGNPTAINGIVELKRLVAAAGDRIAIMPGGGGRIDNVEPILRQTGAREIHTSLGVSNVDAAGFEGMVRKFKQRLDPL